MAFDISAFGVSRERLPCGWVARRIDALALFNPEQINSGYSHSHIAYLDISNVGWGAVSQPTLLPLSDAPSRAKRIVRSHDVILSTVRPGNRAYAFIKEAPDNLIVSTGFAVLRAKQGTADARFVYYLTTSDPIIHYLASIAEEKTAYPSVNPIDIGDCIVPVPPLPEQCAIAHILGTLDDKIELNRRMNDTLEAMARALFKSWFVDFDPVIDNALAAGNPIPGALAEKAARRRALSDKRQPLPDLTRRLFPDRFVDSEVGPIPEGWEVKSLGCLLKLAYGKALKAESRRDGTVAVYGSNGQVGWHDEKLVFGPGIVVGRKGNPGIVTWVPSDFYPIDTTFYVVPKTRKQHLHFLFHTLQGQDIASIAADSAVPGLNRNLAYMNKQTVPPNPIIDQFEEYVCAILALAVITGRKIPAP